MLTHVPPFLCLSFPLPFLSFSCIDDEDFEDEDDDDDDDNDNEENNQPLPATAANNTFAAKPAALPPAPSAPKFQNQQQQQQPTTTTTTSKQPVDPRDALMAALAAENEQALAYHNSRPQMQDLAKMQPAPELQQRTVVSLADIQDNLGITDAQKEVLSARRERWNALMRRVKLQQKAIDEMIDLSPVTAAQLYATGRSVYANLEIKGTQTNDDATEMETQTETWEGSDAASQVPEDLGVSREAIEASAKGGAAAKRKAAAARRSLLRRSDAGQASGALGLAEQRLQSFMMRCGGVVDKLLDERDMRRNAPKSSSQAPSSAGDVQSLSAASIPFACSPRLDARAVTALTFGMGANGELLLAVAYDPRRGPAGASDGDTTQIEASMSLVAIWIVSHERLAAGSLPAAPEHMLCTEGSCRSLCWITSHALVAGLAHGGLCAWDIRETSAVLGSDGRADLASRAGATVVPHPPPILPMYTTEYDPSLSCGGEVCALSLVLTSTAGGASSSSSSSSASTSASSSSSSSAAGSQFISLDTWGRASVWMLLSLGAADLEGANSDFGLRIGGRIRMIQVADHLPLGAGSFATGEVMLGQRDVSGRRLLDRIYTPSLATLPAEQNEFIVAADGGRCLKGARYSRPSAPRTYYVNDDPIESRSGSESADNVVSVDASPFIPGVFAAAHEGGCLAVHHRDRAPALLAWRDFAAGLRCVRWSQGKPGVLFALDDDGSVHIFDLLAETRRSSAVESFGAGAGRPIHLVVPSLAAIGQLKGAVPGLTSLAASTFAVAYDDGLVRAHAFSNRFCAQTTTNVDAERSQMLAVLGLAEAGTTGS